MDCYLYWLEPYGYELVLNKTCLTNYWSFIGMILLKQYLSIGMNLLR